MNFQMNDDTDQTYNVTENFTVEMDFFIEHGPLKL